MKPTDTLDKLIEIAQIRVSNHGNVLSADMVMNQDRWYDVQEKLSNLMLEVAQAIPGGQERLCVLFPYAFEKVQE